MKSTLLFVPLTFYLTIVCSSGFLVCNSVLLHALHLRVQSLTSVARTERMATHDWVVGWVFAGFVKLNMLWLGNHFRIRYYEQLNSYKVRAMAAWLESLKRDSSLIACVISNLHNSRFRFVQKKIMFAYHNINVLALSLLHTFSSLFYADYWLGYSAWILSYNMYR